MKKLDLLKKNHSQDEAVSHYILPNSILPLLYASYGLSILVTIGLIVDIPSLICIYVP